jgi:indole-3-glycerol phosphate synthase
MNILEQIAAVKYSEVKQAFIYKPAQELEKSPHFLKKTISLKNSIKSEGSNGIIAEFKRKSPSKGIINENVRVESICPQYEKAGASAISILTDKEFFGGSVLDILQVRDHLTCPVLRKDFIVDEYQIIEAKAVGADAILLIAELHDFKKLTQLHQFAEDLGMEVLVEIHDENNLSKIPYDTQIIGINSRNLKSFSVNIDHTRKLIERLPEKGIKVAESGISSLSDYLMLKDVGFNAFLIGEYFMKHEDPDMACKSFIKKINDSHENKGVRNDRSCKC